MRYDGPRCHAEHLNAVHVHFVTNQPDGFNPGRNHSSVVVCEARACVLDAMAYVERTTGERAHVRRVGSAVGHECELCKQEVAQ